MNVFFAPDYSTHNPYQLLLAEALGNRGCEIDFLSEYRRGLPLVRGLSGRASLLHLHWPEAYFRSENGRLSRWWRAFRFPIDLALTASKRPFVTTAHNLLPHRHSPLARHNMAFSYRRSRKVIAHSASAADQVSSVYGINRKKIAVIPHGDLAATLPDLPKQDEARTALNLGPSSICLMFGALAPYKGIVRCN